METRSENHNGEPGEHLSHSAESSDLQSASFLSRVQGALWGLLVGDALGVPVEFRSRSELQEDPVEDMRGWEAHHQPPGTWSDDSSLALCSVDSILHTGWNVTDMGNRFCRWLYEGYLTPHGKVFDVGGSTKQALARIKMGIPAVEAGGRSEMDNGNGSLMRILPVALYFWDAPPEMHLRAVSDASSITHAHPRSRLACILYSWIIRKVLEGSSIAEALKALSLKEWNYGFLSQPADLNPPLTDPHLLSTELSHLPANRSPLPADLESLPEELQGEARAFQRIMEGTLLDCSEDEISSGGYVVETLEASLWCVATSRAFSEAVRKAVNLGRDTDTTGAVTGGLAGARWGLEGVPSQWIDSLARREELSKMIDSFSKLLVRPIPFADSYWVLPGKLLAGEYPRTKEEESSRKKLSRLLDSGITAVVDLTEEGEAPYGKPLKPYHELLRALASERGIEVHIKRFPIPDGGVIGEKAVQEMHSFIDSSLGKGRSVYIHCWGGHGRTGLVVGTWLVHAGLVSGKGAIEAIRHLRRNMEDSFHPSPETSAQIRMVQQWKEPV